MKDEQPLEQGMTYVEKLDFRAQEHRHEMERVRLEEEQATKRAKYEHASRRQETVKVVGLSLVAVLAVAVALGFITYWVMGGPPSPDGLSEEERREAACVDSGGGWVPEGMLTSGEGLCVFPGKAVPSE